MAKQLKPSLGKPMGQSGGKKVPPKPFAEVKKQFEPTSANGTRQHFNMASSGKV